MSTALTSRRGGPLAMLCILLGVWTVGRAALWESPFPLSLPSALPSADIFFAEGPSIQTIQPASSEVASGALGQAGEGAEISSAAQFDRLTNAMLFDPANRFGQGQTAQQGQLRRAMQNASPIVAAGHSFLMAAAFKVDWSDSDPHTASFVPPSGQPAVSSVAPPFAPPFAEAASVLVENTDRWSLDAFAFYRAGSGSTSISQGRAPVYGASQVAVNLQYRLLPSSRQDPRIYGRAYRAFVPDAENEAAVGLSVRPFGPVPVRLAAELRVTNNLFGTEIRPAAYAVTELPAQRLPFDLRTEVYGGAGYVGGSADTPFVDGQAAITREVISFEGAGGGSNEQRVRLSLGGGAWGGAQKDASRLDVGPSMRVDLTIGDVPARFSIDWRERVAGDAAPESGIAATLSTRF